MPSVANKPIVLNVVMLSVVAPYQNNLKRNIVYALDKTQVIIKSSPIHFSISVNGTGSIEEQFMATIYYFGSGVATFFRITSDRRTVLSRGSLMLYSITSTDRNPKLVA
jgi:hypothetical protein